MLDVNDQLKSCLSDSCLGLNNEMNGIKHVIEMIGFGARES